MFESKVIPKFLFLLSFCFLFLFLAIVPFKGNVFAQLGLIIVFFLIFLFIIFNFQTGFLALVVLRVALDFFRERKIIEEPFLLNLGGALGIFVLILGLYWFFKKRKEILKIPHLWVILLFLIVGLINIPLLSPLIKMKSFTEWIRIASFFTVYFLISNISATKKEQLGDIKQNKKKNNIFLKVILASAVLPALAGFWQIFRRIGLEDEAGFIRIYGTFAHPNPFSYFLVVVLILLICFFINTNSKTEKKYYLFSIILGITLLIFTYSRGAWAAFLIALFLFGFLKYRKQLFLGSIIFGLFLFFLLFINNWLYRNYNFSLLYSFAPTRRLAETLKWHPYTSSLLWRLELWEDMKDAFWERPFFGQGLGTFEEEALKRRGPYSGSLEAHNDYLRITVELGIIGLISYLLLILVFLGNIIILYKKTTDESFKTFCLGFLTLFISLFLISFGENILRNTIVQWCFWLWAGVIFGNYQKVNRNLLKDT